MTSFEFIGPMTRNSLVFLQETRVPLPQGGPIKPQCPLCTVESAIARPLPFDSHVVCGECGEESEYRQMREALAEQQVNTEFEAAHTRRLARQEAGEIRYVSHEEAGRRLGLTVIARL